MTNQTIQPGRRARKTCATLAAIVLLGAALPASAHRVEKRFAVEERPVVTVKNSHGRITVKSWARPEVQVVGDHSSERVEIDTEKTGNRVEVVTHVLGQNLSTNERRADFEITVPEETELQIRTDSGTILVERVAGDMSFETVAADVELREVAGYLIVRTTGGSLICFRCAGRIEVNSISGNVRLLEPISSNLRAKTLSGNIFYDGDFRPGGIYFLSTGDGRIEVRYSVNDSFNLSASSVRGNVESDVKLKPPAHSSQPPSQLAKGLFGTYNDGTAKVELSSFSGTILVRKRE